MTLKDILSAGALFIFFTVLVLITMTDWFDQVIVIGAIAVAALVVFGCILGAIFHFKKYRRNHPYIPYVGQWAHVTCRECDNHQKTYSIEVFTGGAYEGWNRAGQYYRGFKRLFACTCSNGHAWQYDPILERNEWPHEDRQSFRRSTERNIERMRLERQAVHKLYGLDTEDQRRIDADKKYERIEEGSMDEPEDEDLD